LEESPAGALDKIVAENYYFEDLKITMEIKERERGTKMSTMRHKMPRSPHSSSCPPIYFLVVPRRKRT
jgi:hypothetical protein